MTDQEIYNAAMGFASELCPKNEASKGNIAAMCKAFARYLLREHYVIKKQNKK